MSTFERVKKSIVDVSGVKEDIVTVDAKIYDDLDLDSLDEVDLVITLEVEFNIEISDDEIASAYTVGDIVDAIDAKLGATTTA